MKDAATWVMAYRHRQTAVITALFLVPLGIVVSVGVATASVLAHGVGGALPVLSGSLLILAVAGLVGPTHGLGLAAMSAAVLAGALFLGWLLRKTESLTLTVQISALIAMTGIVLFYVGIGDPQAFWVKWAQASPIFNQTGWEPTESQAEILSDSIRQLALFGTGIAGSAWWLLGVIGLVFGYHLWDIARDESESRFGRFRDLNLGRALAVLLLLQALLAALMGSTGVVANTAWVSIFAFSVHGVALVHWAQKKWKLPTMILPAAYVLYPLGMWQLMSLAGYVDSWFNFSRRQPEAPDT
ncbi:MAG: hypothetical protein AAFN07_02675 [Pseudomonadota bacterium]